MNAKENTIRAATFNYPERIPISFGFNPSCWFHYEHEALLDLMEEHKLLFPNFDRKTFKVPTKMVPWQDASQPYTDCWGCVWKTVENGISGSVVEHPLESYEDFEDYVPPDPEKCNGRQLVDWERIERNLQRSRENDALTRGGLMHGHTFLQLTYIRGYENLLYDMVEENPHMLKLLEMIGEFNLGVIKKYLEFEVEWMGYPEDLGMQVGPMISVDLFKKYIVPIYKKLVRPARDAGCIIHMHSDGDVRLLAEDLMDCGIDVLNIQDLVNGIDWIRDNVKGRAAIDLDIDRQSITRFGTPAEIDALIKEAVVKLGSKEGGLMLMHGLYYGTPLENAKATMDAMEKYSTHWS